MKTILEKARKGFSLVELLIAVVVLGILGAMLIASGTAAQNKARVSVASNDIDSVRNAVYTAFMMNPSVMQYTDATPDAFKNIVDNINTELDENWQWAPIGGAYPTTSGAIAQTTVQLDPWDNPYTMYIYTDTYTTTYASGRGTTAAEKAAHLTEPDSCVYVVIASAGPNGTGVGMGTDGNAGTDRTKMINNTDGVDDIGVVIRILNGSTMMSTFGWSAAGFGPLEYINWYFCGASVGSNQVAGIYTEMNENGVVVPATSLPTYGSSLDQYPNLEKLNELTSVKNAAKNTPAKITDAATS